MTSRPRPLEDGEVVEGFDCGVPSLNEWLTREAPRARKRGNAVPYVLESDGRVAGYYCLSNGSLVRASLNGWIARNAPLEIPVTILGRLAVDERFQGRGFGYSLLKDALERAMRAREVSASRALVVDPIDDGARDFYLHHGFRELPGTGRLALPLK